MDPELKSVLFRVVPFLLIIFFLSLAIYRGKLSREDLYLKKPVSKTAFVLWIFLFLLYILITEYGLYHFGLLEVSEWNGDLLPSVLKIIGIVILAPVAEELVFRAVLIYWLRKLKMNIHLAILLQAVLFLLLHSFGFENSLAENIFIFQVFTDALLYGYAMYFTRSLYTPILMHASGNSIAVLEQFIL